MHHANVLLDRQESSRSQEKHPGDGFPGMELRIESETFDPDSHLFFWKPGSVPHVEPDGMALRLEPGNDFVLNTHLQPSGKPESIAPRIGLYFTDEPATQFPVLLELQNDLALDIPANDSDFHVNDEFTIPVDVDLDGDLSACALPGQGTCCDGKLAKWHNENADPYSPMGSELAGGLLLCGTSLPSNGNRLWACTIPMTTARETSRTHFILRNASMGGNRTVDEMAHLWLQVLPRKTAMQDGDARMKLQEALARHDVERNPSDFAAQYNLGAMLQSRGETEEALPHYQAAVGQRPSDAIANNALGGALLAVGRANEAVAPLRLAVQSKPNYFAAHYNLGNALASLGKFRPAIQEFEEAVRLNPEDSMAETNLGAALAEIDQLTSAQMHLEKALKLDANNSLARENLEEVRSRIAAGKKP